MQVVLGTKTIDISGVIPLRLKDVGALAAAGLDLNKAGQWTTDQLITFVHYILAKADASITREEAAELPLPELAGFVEAAMGTKAPLPERT